MTKKLLLLLLSSFTSLLIFAQDSTRGVQMADAMRENGKIYVVVAVIVTIFAGIVFYLVRLDRKITSLEKHKF